MSKKVNIPVTAPEIKHLLSLVEHNSGPDGWYTGPRAQFEARQERLRLLLEKALALLGGGE